MSAFEPAPPVIRQRIRKRYVLLAILVADLEDSIQNETGFWVLLFELFTAGRRNPDIQREVAELFARTKGHVADILRADKTSIFVRVRRMTSYDSSCAFTPPAM